MITGQARELSARKEMDALPETGLGRSIFDLSAAHSAYLLGLKQTGNALLASFFQLVQRDELEYCQGSFCCLRTGRHEYKHVSRAESHLLTQLFSVVHPKLSVLDLKILLKDRGKAVEFATVVVQYRELLQVDLAGYGYQRSFFNSASRKKCEELRKLRRNLKAVDSRFLQDVRLGLGMRDMAPLLFPYALAFGLTESYLDKVEQNKEMLLGLMDLFDSRNDYESLSFDRLKQTWQSVRAEFLVMAYFLEAVLVNCQLQIEEMRQKPD